MNRKTVLIVAPYFPPHSGGLERYALEIGKALHMLGWRVVVVTSGDAGRTTEAFEGLTVYRLPYAFKISNTPFSLAWLWEIRRILREERPDVVNVHTPVPGIGDITAFLTRAPLVVTYHSGSMRKGKWRIDVIVALYESCILPLLLRKAAHVISASDAVRSGFLKEYAHKSSTLSPAVNCDTFYPAPELVSEPRLIFITAQLSRAYVHKGFPHLLKALQELHVRGVRASLDVVGDGDMRATYEADVRDIGLNDFVRFHGALENGELAAVYRDASLFILPTSNDSYPIAVLEAMASGLPVISTRVGDIPRMMEDGKMGYVIEPHDEKALVEKIEILLNDYALRAAMGKYAREKTCAHSTWQDRASRMETILERSLARRIIQISGYYPPHIGGIERIVSTAAHMLVERGRQVEVITSGGPSIGNPDIPSVKKLTTIEFAHTPFTPTLLFHLFTLPRSSIMHVHLAQAYWPDMVRLASWLRGIPYIAHYHLEVGPSGFWGPLFTIYKKLTWGPFLRGAAHVIACSEAQKEWICARYGVDPTRIAVIPNAVDEAFFGTGRTPPEGIVRLLAIGRLTSQKRMDRLIDACAHAHTPLHLTIAGDGEDRAALEARAREKGVPVTFAGRCDDAQMQALHRTHDVFLIASEREGGTPLTVLEAFAAGLPVIAGDVSGVKELVQGIGVLVEPTPAGFGRAIDELFRDPDRYRRHSRLGIEKAHGHSWRAYVDELEGLYDRL
ncbi:hypothetical protein A2765_04445 [Candidatus Kaiserbacteria bacterium RIFCSPHIGHO2_01_FULL_56_24]|uniref:Glycosyltransferase subfamily 4-like N-terminal domain-containing protein n=1 Tax=Candidatus Kaiserbacteria bacterium RIFCSPHIGHO2_01_FULL_56_24 TaxID=1798487 RepID=A0A1F6DEF2_9BACT|nr:MAG: hypothetical protein A2765_04445 [Candidatus Kaiserbacteria bacterium RIFCSPHIGHO2_01_FULL_56_24]